MRCACQFYYFRFGDQTKRSINALLRSLAFQIAEQVPKFRLALASMSNNGVRLENTDARSIWQKLFVSVLFKLELTEPLYWILDAIDESDSSKSLLELISKLSSSKVPVRVIVASRRNVILSSAFTRLASSISLEYLSIDNNLRDIRLYVESEMHYMHGNSEFRDRMIHKVLERADANFLWVHLAVQEILQCHTQDDIGRVLEELPPGMESLYYRMQANIVRSNKSGDIELAKQILSWAICSRRPLSVDELSEALDSDFPDILDLKHTISQVYGQFIVRALDVTFSTEYAFLLTGLNNLSVQKLVLSTISEGWQTLDPRLLREDFVHEATNRNAPCCIAYNYNATQIAVAYRGFPLSVWSIEKPRLINRCKRIKAEDPATHGLVLIALHGIRLMRKFWACIAVDLFSSGILFMMITRSCVQRHARLPVVLKVHSSPLAMLMEMSRFIIIRILPS